MGQTNCVHRWLVPEPRLGDPYVMATCRLCKASKRMRAHGPSTEDGTYVYNNSLMSTVYEAPVATREYSREKVLSD